MDAPLVVAFIADLMFAVRVENAAQTLNYQVKMIERADQVAHQGAGAPRRQLAEHLSGSGAALIDTLTRWHPALLIFDLGNEHIPWREWLPLIKSAPATRRIPVVCYGSHVDSGTLKLAQSSGSDAVLARSQFTSDLPDILKQYARVIDYDGLLTACKQPLTPLAVRGLEEFNRQEFFEAHETLEEAWNHDQSLGKELYRAILQVAVAYLQIERKNYRGARKMFLRLRQWIDPLPGVCRGVQVDRLRRDAEAVYAQLIDLGPERISEFDRSLFTPVHFSTVPGAPSA